MRPNISNYKSHILKREQNLLLDMKTLYSNAL